MPNTGIPGSAITPQAYRDLFERVVASGEPYGPAGYSPDYTKLNLARTRRIERALRVPPEVRTIMEQAPPQDWLIITEPWCGDSAQNLPVLEAMAAMAVAITVHIALRDDGSELIGRYLTNGTRSIPKLVAFEPTTGRELFTWGPRPSTLMKLVAANKSLPEEERLGKEVLAERVHRWYHENGGQETQREIAGLVLG